MKVKNIVIIGGSGFIGSHTADELSRQGHKVKLFDRSPSQWIRNDQEQVIGDILDRDLIGKVISGADIVYHFASIADISEAKERFKERLEKIDWNTYYKSWPFNESALTLYEWAPIAEELKTLDRKIVLNSMILKWDNIKDEFIKLIKI